MNAPCPIVDSHHHVWDPARRRHAWLDEAAPELRRRFDLEDFSAASSSSGVEASILVQALADAAETKELLECARGSALVIGVVGWVDLAAGGVADELEALRRMPGGAKLVGIRHLVQDEPDPRWLERHEVIEGLQAVADAGLTFDLLVRSRELPSAVVAVDAVGGGRFVLDHGGKPEIATGTTEPWSQLVSELAERPFVACKLSGFVSEAGKSWTARRIEPYVDHLLDRFGPERLLFGSDWPVCTAAASYEEVVNLMRLLLDERLTAEELMKVMATNAMRVYRIEPARR